MEKKHAIYLNVSMYDEFIKYGKYGDSHNDIMVRIFNKLKKLEI